MNEIDPNLQDQGAASANLWLHSTKYDGSLHYRYPVRMVEKTDERLVTYCEPGVPVESYRGASAGKRHLLSFFWRERPYVLHVEWDQEWQPYFLYVDIATATGWSDGTVRYTDMDLDLILRPGQPVHLDDVDEFELHRVRFAYPEELVATCWNAVEEVRGLLQHAKEPFSSTMYCWRPGKAEQSDSPKLTER